jgi:hypothetical protein
MITKKEARAFAIEMADYEVTQRGCETVMLLFPDSSWAVLDDKALPLEIHTRYSTECTGLKGMKFDLLILAGRPDSTWDIEGIAIACSEAVEVMAIPVF